MEELRRSLDRAYRVLSTIPVAGDAVEKMALVREELRKAYSLAGEDAKEAPNG